MRQIAISVFALFVSLPALADARLPVVNISAGAVSARAAFGEPVIKPAVNVTKTEQQFAENNLKNDSINNKESRVVVAREASKKTGVYSISSDNKKDEGEKIIAGGDILIPRRPSSDLWAKSDTPLRLPQPEEFSVIKADFELPEESIDSKPVRSVVARSVAPKQNVVSEQDLNKLSSNSEIDLQIARLNELQKQAEESVQEKKLDDLDIKKKMLASGETEDDFGSKKINLTRLVVPVEQDVVVRAVEKTESPKIKSVRNDMTQMSPTELRKAFRKTFLSENKHLSTFQIDDRFDVASDVTSEIEGFTSERDLSETGGIRPLEIKIKFRNDDSALSRANYNLLTEYAGIVLSNPTRAIQVSIPESSTRNSDDRKLAARRLAIVEQVLRDTGVSEQRILPVLSQRDEDGLVLRMISLDQYETLTKKQRDMFGDTVSKKSYKSLAW